MGGSAMRAVPSEGAVAGGAVGRPARSRSDVRGARPGRGVGPEPSGPGRPVRGSRVRSAAVPVGRVGAARPVAVRVTGGLAGVARRPSPVPAPWVARVPRRAASVASASSVRWSSVVQFVVVAVLAAAVVGALGLLSAGARESRVPSVTARVQVHAGESLWQVARRVAPSADPGAVAARIVELNHLGSPSVAGGSVLLSPIG